MKNDVTAMGVAALSAALAARGISALEATQAHLAHIEKTDGEIGAYITVTAERALAHAQRIDEKRAAGEALSSLAGVPGALKDNICTDGVPTTCASKMLANFVPPYSAFVAQQLTAHDAIVLGKLNMDEFAMGSSTENSSMKMTRNPRNTACVPGGSSGGSAAALAANEAAWALGSDTGGSIRQPAAFCGVVGLKPTYGVVSRWGVVAFASSLDQVGPMARTVRDTAMVMNAIAGFDKRDSTSIRADYPDYTKDLDRDIRGMRIALPREYFGEGLSPEIRDAILAAAKTYESLGAHVEEVSLPTLPHALSAFYVISSAEASSNLARFDGVKYGYCAPQFKDLDDLYCRTRSEGFGPEVKRRILLGTFALSSGYYDAYYKKAMQVRTLITRDFERIYADHDVILAPVAPTTAFRFGEKSSNPLEMYMGDVYTVPVNIAGLPALSLPCGQDTAGLPIGMQLIGRAFGECDILRAGTAFEAARGGVK